MKSKSFLACLLLLAACSQPEKQAAPDKQAANPLLGTWKLVTGTIVEKGDSTITDYTKDKSFVKIINETHFAFLLHDLNKGQDSTTAVFASGGGRYSLKDSTYTEHLEYCTDRAWEGHDFPFTVTITGDTLVQRGVEKVEAEGIERLNIERYVRAK
ncbi:MAG: hypothetical protein IPN76_18270 [Saprospiraceae bacterium]|nr:hypothetical protein [Saprospiraceae bacterium]